MDIELIVLNKNSYDLLREYREIRDRSLSAIMKVSKAYYDDPFGTIVAAIKDGKLIGGIRLDNGVLGAKQIPTEILGYRLQEYLDLPEHANICQLTGLGIDLHIRDKASVAALLIRKAIDLAIQRGAEVLVVHAALVNSRLYRKIFFSMGLHLQIHSNLDLPIKPGFEAHRMVVSTLDLGSSHQELAVV